VLAAGSWNTSPIENGKRAEGGMLPREIASLDSTYNLHPTNLIENISMSDSRSAQLLDTALTGAQIVKDASEAMPVLTPLKGAATVLIRILESTRVNIDKFVMIY
jgi:hypothetical protein